MATVDRFPGPNPLSLPMATHRFSLAAPLALALLIVFGTVGVVSPQTSVTQYVQINASSEASGCEAEEGGKIWYEVSLEVFNPDNSGSVGASLTVVGSGPNGESVEVECADVATAFIPDLKDLSTATLAPTAFDLYLNVCDPDTKECDSVLSQTVTLAVEWSTVGPCSGRDAQVFVFQQRSIGQAMRVTANGQNRFLLYPEFLNQQHEPALASHRAPPHAFLDRISPEESCRWMRLKSVCAELETSRTHWERLFRECMSLASLRASQPSSTAYPIALAVIGSHVEG
jgi:hypothetical protein